MRRWRLAGTIAALTVVGTAAVPSAAPAPTVPVPAELILTPPVSPDGLLVVAPLLGANPAQRFTLTPAPPPSVFYSPSRAEPETPLFGAAAPKRVPPPAPLPPSLFRDAEKMVDKPAVAAVPAAAPVMPIAPPEAAAPVEPLSEREVVSRANAFFTRLGTLVAEFVQVAGDGRRLRGSLYLQRPGKVRFEYEKPATLEVVADGSSVAVRDTKLATQDLYAISQTPLKFLLREQVNLGRDIRIRGVEQDGDSVRLTLEDRSTLGGTSQIILYFDPQVENLTQWRITDPQGFQTVIILEKVDRTKRLDPSLFVINYDRVIPTDNLYR
jgi:outer membrane lipoprotein-sorting protein